MNFTKGNPVVNNRWSRILISGMAFVFCFTGILFADAPPPECDDPCSPGCWAEGEPCCYAPYTSYCCYLLHDCNGNGIRDTCDISVILASGYPYSENCNSNPIPDECELDDNDCNANNIPDECDTDCNTNGTPDECDISSGVSDDDNANNIPDECETKIWYVDDVPISGNGHSPLTPFNTIQEGMDVASDGEIVMVLDGTYTGVGNRNLYFNGEKIVVRSLNGPAKTIIDCESATNTRAFFFYDDETHESVLSGFTIKNGNTLGHGGGIDINDSAPLILNCIFTSNHSDGQGGGIHCSRPNSDGKSPIIANCLFYDNTADVGGGLVAESGSTSISIMSCTFTENSAPTAGGIGIGYTNPGGAPSITNSIIYGNSIPEYFFTDTNLSVTYTCMNSSPVYTGIGNTNNPNNVTLFADFANHDFTLNTSVTNPCIDTGDTSALVADLSDLDEDLNRSEVLPLDLAYLQRVLNSIVDMGAYESIPTGLDCNSNGTTDCDSNGFSDECDLFFGIDSDCNTNSIPDHCELSSTTDCNQNGILDSCDLISLDCNKNGVPDDCDIHDGTSWDCNGNGVPDTCEGLPVEDCNTNGISDLCDIADDSSLDINDNNRIDWCEWGIDLDVDSDNNNDNNFPDRSESEELLEDGTDPDWIMGKLIDPNDDDDNGNDIPDYTEDYVYPDDSELIPMILDIDAPLPPLQGRSSVKYWLYEPAYSYQVKNHWESYPFKLWKQSTKKKDSESTDSESTDDVYNLDFGEYEYKFQCPGDLDLDFALSENDLVIMDCIISQGSESSCGQGEGIEIENVADLNRDGNFAGSDDRQLLADRIANQTPLQYAPVVLWVECRRGDWSGKTRKVSSIKAFLDVDGNGDLDTFETSDYSDKVVISQRVAQNTDDCNSNGIIDTLDITNGTSEDCNRNWIPDECEADCNTNGLIDDCELLMGSGFDCNANMIPDECDLRDNTWLDSNFNGQIDTCETEPVVDLDVDSDNNNGTGMPDRTYDEEGAGLGQSETEWWCDENQGKRVALNNDDDDHDGIRDDLDPHVPGEDDLVPIVLDIQSCPISDSGVSPLYRLKRSENDPPLFCRVWTSPEKGETDGLTNEIGTYYHDYYSINRGEGSTAAIVGDLNADFVIDNLDTEILQCLVQAGINCTTLEDRRNRADINRDGFIDASDVPALEHRVDHQLYQHLPIRLWVEWSHDPDQDGDLINFGLTVSINVDANSSASDPIDLENIDRVSVVLADAGDCERGAVVGVLPSESCVGYMDFPYDSGDFDSYCWSNNMYPAGEENGYGANLDVILGFGPADFPPLHVDAFKSSSPLVSKASVQQGRSMNVAERPTHAHTIDFITGMPLIQETDFELPFGGAVFRHIRTYSENFANHELMTFPNQDGHLFSNAGNYMGISNPYGTHWDWNGLNWMMGENPIFLIDAKYEGIVGDHPKRCYFIPDAHHAIPFEYIPATGQYAAPPWFDAQLKYDTGADGLPSQFRVYMHRGAVQYTIQPIYDDLPMGEVSQLTSPLHDAPPDGYGLPYLGLVTEIKDRHGNKVVLDYCGFNQGSGDYDGTPNCKECVQDCGAKGRVKRAQLFAADNHTTPVWTLLYTYRSFDFYADWGVYFDVLQTPTMLHAIHVYKGHVDPPVGMCDPLNWEEIFFDQTSFAEYDAVDVTSSAYLDPPLPSDWSIEVRYMYSEGYVCDYTDWDWETYPCCAEQDVTITHAYANTTGFGYQPPGMSLLKTTVTRKSDSDITADEIELPNYTIYRYGARQISLNGFWNSGTVTANSQWSYLQDIIYSDTIAEYFEENNTTDPNVFLEDDTTDSIYDLRLWKHETTGWNSCQAPAYDIGEDQMQHLADWCELPVPNTVYYVPGTKQLHDLRSNSEKPGEYAFHFFQTYPNPVILDEDVDWEEWCEFAQFSLRNPNIYHYPYRVQDPIHCQMNHNQKCTFTYSDLSEVRFTAVIDEIDTNGTESYVPATTNGAPVSGFTSRRVVEMNAVGFILRDRTWSFEEDDYGVLVSQDGFAKSYKHDCRGRLKEERSEGWSVAANPGQPDPEFENADPDHLGLIVVYEYENGDDSCSWSDDIDGCVCGDDGFNAIITSDDILDEPIAAGIKNGREEPVYYFMRMAYEPGRPDLLVEETHFPQPVLDYTSATGNTTTTTYSFTGVDEEKRVISKVIERPAIAGSSVDSTLYHSVEKEKYDDNGNLTHFGWGSVRGSSVLEFFINVTQYDNKGRKTLEAFDAPKSGAYGIPDDWNRVSATDPLHRVTEYEYDDIFGLVYTKYPNGLEQHIEIDQDPANPMNLTMWIYKDFDPDQRRTLSPVVMSEMEGGQVKSTSNVLIEASYETPGIPENYTVLNEIETEVNASGQITGLKQSTGEEDAPTREASIRYFPNGKPQRTQSPDGTITQYTFTERGQLEKTFRGTADGDSFWNVNVDDEYDNMILLEKRYYGAGVRNAGLLTQVRRYDAKTSNPYLNIEGEGEDITVPPDDGDSQGWVEHHYYDWRMREVWVETKDFDGTVISNTLTWYDNLDNVLVTAVYDGPVPTDVDPTEIDESFPTIPDEISPIDPIDTLINSTIYGELVQPSSLTRTIHNARGLVEETRTYWGADLYHSTRTYYDHADRPVEIVSESGYVQRMTYDAKNRLVSTASGVYYGTDFHELSRSEKIYDNDQNADGDVSDRLTQTIHYERHIENTIHALDGTNSIRTWAYTWYDEAGNLLIRADFGTNNDTYANDSDPPAYQDHCCSSDCDPDDLCLMTADADGIITSCGDPLTYPTARFTCYGYDETGRQNQVMDPAGRLSYTQYDAFGQQVLTVENYNEVDNDPQRITAYLYNETTGYLSEVAAVKPDHFGGGAVAYGNIAWDRADGTLQVTRYEYEALVIQNSNGALEDVSTNGQYIAAVYYPDPETGQDSLEPSVEFRYDFAGRVAERTDARGVVLRYDYDMEDQLRKIRIDRSGVPASAGGWFYVNADVSSLEYDFTASGQLESARVVDDSAILNESSFTYGTMDHLATASQTLDDLSVTQRTVEYDWDISSTGGYSRLLSMTYPSGTSADLTFGYGTGGNLDSRFSRLTDISLSGLTERPIAQWSYLPGGRQIGHSLYNEIGYTYRAASAEDGLDGLDGFGRVIDRDYQLNGSSVLQYQYGYTPAGNRSYMRQTGHPAGDDHSWQYDYDALDRLVGATEGTLDAAGNLLTSQPHVHEWALDPLGNLSGELDSQVSYRSFIDINDDGQWDSGDTLQVFDHHDTGEDNQIASRVSDSGAGAGTEYYLYDKVGNLVIDSRHFYRYDVFNRVTEIYDLNTIEVDTNGEIGTNGSLGDCLFAYEYDALGRRVITVEKPGNPTDEKTWRHVYGSGADTLVEYEITDDGSGGGSFAETLLRYFIWGESFPDPLVLADCTAATGGSGSGDPLDNVGFYFYLKDELGSTTALTDANGVIVEAYLYSPYGETSIWDATGTNDITTNGSAYSNPFCFTGQRFEHQTGLYHFWARTYSPVLQRWIQKDALGILGYGGGEPAGSDGTTPLVSTSYGYSGSEYEDGMNLYLYVQTRPTVMTDPNGRMSYIEIGAVNGLGMDLESNTMDTGFGILGAMAGFAGLVSERNMQMELLVGISCARASNDSLLGGIDFMLIGYEAYQTTQLARLGVGVLSSGVKAAQKARNILKKTGGSIWDALEALKKDRYARIGSTGKVGEDALKLLGGKSQQRYDTSLGPRIIDQLVGRVANESKVGYTSLTKRINKQIAKDKELISKKTIDSSIWHFFRSPKTGKCGPSGPLEEALLEAGIVVVIHP